MAVTTRLTAMQEKKLQNHFGGKQFTLLYKASVHAFSEYDFLSRCSNQGPTVMVIYGGPHVLGTYVKESYKKDERVPIVLFVFKEKEISQCNVGAYSPSKFLDDYNVRWQSSEFLINLRDKNVAINLDAAKKLGLPQNQPISFEECEVFRCEGRFNQIILYRVLS